MSLRRSESGLRQRSRSPTPPDVRRQTTPAPIAEEQQVAVGGDTEALDQLKVRTTHLLAYSLLRNYEYSSCAAEWYSVADILDALVSRWRGWSVCSGS